MIQIYTGNGKGKTTAALGLAFRALGQNKKVLLIQFLKKGRHWGELKAAKRFSNFKVLQTGSAIWVNKNNLTAKAKLLAQEGLALAQKALESEKYNLIILDELNVAMKLGLLQVAPVKEMLQQAHPNTELVITGRYAHPQILKLADLVSEIKAVRHYYRRGIKARAGIEY